MRTRITANAQGGIMPKKISTVREALFLLFPANDYVLTKERVIKLVGKECYILLVNNGYITELVDSGGLGISYKISQKGIGYRDERS